MKRRLKRFLVSLLFMVPAAVVADPPSHQSLHTPEPPYPYEARAHNVVGDGKCQLVFDGSGHVASALMIVSTGSSLLDENTVDFARQHWRGTPGERVVVPISYQLTFKASAMVRVVYGVGGQVARAGMVKSTGLPILDKTTMDFARNNWSGKPGSTQDVPITFTGKVPIARVTVADPSK